MAVEDRRRLGIRLSAFQYVIIVVFSVLSVSFWVLQVVQHPKYEELAENNHQRTLPLRAPRGIVFDRNNQILVENPFVKFYNNQRGYVTCDVTPKQLEATYQIVPYVTKPDAPRSTRAKFVVESGRPGAIRSK